jgi:2'-5' RNA ligase
MALIESALVVLVPEAEVLVKPFRHQYDPSAAVGMPAHITLLYPFKPPNEVGSVVVDNLRHLFARFAPFRYSLVSIQRFPVGVLYLAPQPDEPFRRLTLAIWSWYPEIPPYGGKWPDIVPHLSVANMADEQQLDRVAEAFAQAAQRKLPIGATAKEVALIDNRSGRWRICATLGLGRE